MKILFISGWYPPATRGGGEVSTHYLAQGLRSLGHDVQVVTQGHIPERTTVDGVPVQKLPLSLTGKPLFERGYARAAAHILQEHIEHGAYDIIHAHDFRSALAVSELSLKNTIVTARDYAQVCGSTNNLAADGSRCPGCTWTKVWKNHRVAEVRFPRKFFRAWQFAHNSSYRRQAFASFAAQVFISHAQQVEIQATAPIINGIQTVIYNPVGDELLQMTSVKTATSGLLCVGTVEDYKGVRLLLRAFRKLSTRYPSLHLTVVGEGSQRREYENLVARWGLQYRIKFSGAKPRHELKGLYDAAAVVVAPAVWIEPFGRTVVEAMARGKIVLAAKAGGPAEIISDAKTGLVFERNSLESLTKTLRRALDMKAIEQREIQRSAQTWVRDNLGQEKISREYEALYQRVIT